MSEQTELDGQFAIQTRGLWRTENDFMGGPFINYTVYDDKSDIVYGIDGFVLFPLAGQGPLHIRTGVPVLKTFEIAGRSCSPSGKGRRVLAPPADGPRRGFKIVFG